MRRPRRRKGVTMVLCMIFMTVFLARGVSLEAMSGSSVQISANQQRGSRALAAAESGLEVLHYWLKQVVIETTATAPSEYYGEILSQLKDSWYHANATNLKLSNTGALQSVSLESNVSQSFSAQLTMDPCNPVGGICIPDVTVTGSYQGLQRTISTQFNITPYVHPIFKYGLATKGPIQFPNNPTTTTVTSNWEADVYTESSGSAVGVSVGGNANFAGDIMIANPGATVSFGAAVQIAGDTGQDAIDNHVTFGTDPVEFPTADTSRFLTYATGPVVDPCTMDLTKGIKP